MPVTIEVVDAHATVDALEKVFAYFDFVDKKFSTYKEESEISRINRNEISSKDYSREMKEIFSLAEETKYLTDGYFDIHHNGICDPSGIVKGWAIRNAARILKGDGYANFYVDAGGDIETAGVNEDGGLWSVGIHDPFSEGRFIVKTVYVSGKGVATSGTYIRGVHIYDPHAAEKKDFDIVSMTVIGPDIYEADRFATAAFAMGRKGIEFVERLGGFEGYMIDKNGIATMTTGFEVYIQKHA